MKRISWIFTTLAALTFAATVQAEVPSLINYQGRLTDKAGTPVNGAVDVVLRVYDAKTEGKKVYEETISQVSVVNGVYSFGYGEEGKTVKRAAEVVAVADGETKVFNYSTEHKPLLGDVQLSDGTYTWGSSSGPSDAVQFIGSINAELGNVTAIYIQNAPAKDTIINTVYHYHEEGIIGALSQNKECWQELTINGKSLSPRERLVSVPFALYSQFSAFANTKRIIHPSFISSAGSSAVYSTPIHGSGPTGTGSGEHYYVIDGSIRDSFTLNYKFRLRSSPQHNPRIVIELKRYNFRNGDNRLGSGSSIIQRIDSGELTSAQKQTNEMVEWENRKKIKIPNYDPYTFKYFFRIEIDHHSNTHTSLDLFYLTNEK